MTWRQDIQLSGLNVMTLGIFYEALQRYQPHPGCEWHQLSVSFHQRPCCLKDLPNPPLVNLSTEAEICNHCASADGTWIGA